MGSLFTKAILTSTSNPFTIVNSSTTTKYRGSLSSNIVWKIESATFLELQNADGTACLLQASIAALQSAFKLAQGNTNLEGAISINLSNFNNVKGSGKGGISQEDREAIEKTFEDAGRLYIRLSLEGGKELPLYVQLLGD